MMNASPALRTTRRIALAAAVAAALAATFSLYGRPSMLLDLGQMIGLCG